MKRVIRLGLVGCGKRGIGVSREFAKLPECRVTAVMDRYESCVERAAEALSVRESGRFTDFDAMLREAPVDAIFFACSPLEQVELACAAMNRGKHVCTEVPAAFSVEELCDLIRAQEKTGCKYQLMEQVRYAGFVETWKAMHERGEFGHLCQVQGEYVHYRRNWGYWTDTHTGEILDDFSPPAGRNVEPTWRYRVLGEPIYYLPHTMSPLLRILDDRVVKVSCMGTRRGSYTYPDRDLPWTDIQYALMHTAKDTIMLVGAGFSLPHVSRGPMSSHWYELRGTRASVESPRHPGGKFYMWRMPPEGYAEKKQSYEEIDLGVAPLTASAEELKSGHGGLDYVPVKTFVEAVLEDKTPPVDAYVAADITAPAVVAAASARKGGELMSVPEFRKGR